MSDLIPGSKPHQIIELQLDYLLTKAKLPGCLTDQECRSLEALIRCRLLLERVQPLANDDTLFDGKSIEQMKAELEAANE